MSYQDHAHRWRIRSTHHTLDGPVRYEHCACGRWRVLTGDRTETELYDRPALTLVNG